MPKWDEYEGEQNSRLWVIAGAMVVVLGIGAVVAFNVQDDVKGSRDKALAEATEPTVRDTVSTTTETTLANTTTSTTLPLSPEGEVFPAEMLARFYNVDNSELQPSIYNAAVTAGTSVLKARTTGEGKDAYTTYLNRSSGLSPMETLRIDHVWAHSATNFPYLIKVKAWWGGTQTGNLEIKQATTAMYLDAATYLPIAKQDLPTKLQNDSELKTTYVDD